MYEDASTAAWSASAVETTYLRLTMRRQYSRTAVKVSPLSVTVNATSNYTFAGEHGLFGDVTLAKKGRGVLTLANRNAYTGATVVEEVEVTTSPSGTRMSCSERVSAYRRKDA